MALDFRDMETLIPNTTMKAGYMGDVLRVYSITPVDGYVLHDRVGDIIDLDPETGEEFVVTLRYGTHPMQVNASYDFTPFEMTAEGITVIAYGNREFFAIPRDVIQNPVDQIYGGGGTVAPPVEVASTEDIEKE